MLHVIIDCNLSPIGEFLVALAYGKGEPIEAFETILTE